MKKPIILTAVILLGALGACFRIISAGNVRAVEFISIFAAGALAGVLLTQLFMNRNNTK